MNTSPGSVRPAASSNWTDVALLRAVATMRPGWVVLRDCLLAGDGRGARAPVRYALLHPEIGIALLDVLPGTTTPGAPHGMRRLLDARGFRLAFGDYPPIVYLCIPSRRLSELAPLLAQNFNVLPPLALAGGSDWVAAVESALATAEEPASVWGPTDDDRRPVLIEAPESGRTEGWSAPQRARGFGGLGVFWSAVALTLGGGALLLQYLGPPEQPAAVADASTGSEDMRFASQEAWLKYPLLDAAAPSNPGPMLALWPAEPMRTRSDAGYAEGAAILASGIKASVGTRPDGSRSAPADLIAPVRPPRPQVAGAGAEAPSAFISNAADDSGSDDVGSAEATQPLPLLSEAESDAPEPAYESDEESSDGDGSPAAVGTAADADAAQTTDSMADDGAPAPASRSRSDAAAEVGRDGGPVAPPSPGFDGTDAPGVASLPIAPPIGASGETTGADPQDPPRADPLSARGPDGNGGADVRSLPTMDPEAPPADSATRGGAPAPEPPPAQHGSQALVPPATDAHAADPAAASAAEAASSSVPAAAGVPVAAAPAAIPAKRAEPLPDPVRPAETAVPSPAAAVAAGVATPATKPQQPPPSVPSTAAVAALLARGDALIAIGDVAAARLVYQRAAVHASARAATAAGKTYDPRFLQAIGAIGVVADPDAAAAWYRKGSALGDESAASLLSDLDVKARR